MTESGAARGWHHTTTEAELLMRPLANHSRLVTPLPSHSQSLSNGLRAQIRSCFFNQCRDSVIVGVSPRLAAREGCKPGRWEVRAAVWLWMIGVAVGHCVPDMLTKFSGSFERRITSASSRLLTGSSRLLAASAHGGALGCNRGLYSVCTHTTHSFVNETFRYANLQALSFRSGQPIGW